MINKHPVNRWRYARLPWLLLVITLLFTVAACYFSSQNVENRARDRFTYRITQVADSVKGRMLEYEQVLRGGVGLFLVSPSVSRQQWHDFVTNSEMPVHYPGIQNMAVSVPIPAAQKKKHIDTVRAEGLTE